MLLRRPEKERHPLRNNEGLQATWEEVRPRTWGCSTAKPSPQGFFAILCLSLITVWLQVRVLPGPQRGSMT